MRVLAITVGLPKPLEHRGHRIVTGIFKAPVAGPVHLRRFNLDGDGQGDLKVHGGVDKAVYGYSDDAYAGWRRIRPQDTFGPGAMGENLCVDRLVEADICVGDRFELGEAVLEASEPRFPCQTLAMKFHDAHILKQFMELARPGVYFRVIQEGLVEAGQELRAASRARVRVSIQELFETKTKGAPVAHRIREMLASPSLTEPWRRKLQAMLDAQ